MSQPEFFGRTERALAALAASPIDHAFVRELAACKEGDRARAVRNAVHGALNTQLEATQREIRAHATIADPRSWRTLMERVEAATQHANTTKVVDDYLRGEPPPARYRRVLDLDADLRGQQ